MKDPNAVFTFKLEAIDHAIVEALQNAIENDMPDIMADYNLLERNGYALFRWNVIIAQLREKCQHLGWLDLGICKRRGWKTPVLFYSISRDIITFMTENTFKDVQRRKDKGKHYLCAGASFNHDLQPQVEQLMMELPPVNNDDEGWIATSQEQLASSVQLDVGEINGHILILFDASEDKLLKVRAVRLTKSLEISTEEENWSKYIGLPYAANQTINPQQNDDDDADEGLVELL